ncbi:TATA box-binding protein-like 2 [Anopheles maculipalpis]|uniref:TATA box-binding protein-like 2 n=1 Tax=Anopheles maculipalpis TaxID=1496333 RepID=UPI00215922CC|nr:TATA box-binding protein-like 2 [Anopheles maculipalpis]
MHSTSQGGSMAATLLQQKTFMNGGLTATSSNSAGAPDGSVSNPTVSGPGTPTALVGTSAAGGGVGLVKTFLPVSKTLIHHLLPNHALQTADHHTATGNLLHRGNSSTGAFVVVSSPTLDSNNHHRTEQYRTNRGTASVSTFNILTSSGCEDPPASALDEIFSPLPRQAESTTQPLELGTDCVWDAIEPAPVTTITTPSAIGQCQQQPTTSSTNQDTINPHHKTDSSESTLVAVSDVSNIEATEQSPEQSETNHAPEAADEQDAEPEPEIDIVINNVVCSFSVRCHLNLHEIALNGDNVEFRRENGMVTMKLRRPYTTASIWSSGKITCTGATSEDQAKVAARRYSRCLQKLGFNVRLRNFRIVNVLGTCAMPWGIKIVNFSEKYKKDASYEPELHPGVTYKLHSPRATLKIFSTGSITVTAASVAYVQAAIEHIFPLVYEFRKKRTPHEKLELLQQPPAFDQQDFDMPDDGEPDPTAAGTVCDPTQHELDDLVEEDYEMHDEVELENATAGRLGTGNTKAIDKSNSIRVECATAKGGQRFVR